MNQEFPGIYGSFKRVFKSKRMWVAAIILYLGIGMALQQKIDLNLANFPQSNTESTREYGLYISDYGAGSLLEIHGATYQNDLEVLVEGKHTFKRTLSFSGDNSIRTLWLPANALDEANLRLTGANLDSLGEVWLKFPQQGQLLFIFNNLFMLAGLTVILFAFALSLLFSPINIVRYGFFLAVLLAILATYFLGLPLLLRAPLAFAASLSFLILALLIRIIRKRPLIG